MAYRYLTGILLPKLRRDPPAARSPGDGGMLTTLGERTTFLGVISRFLCEETAATAVEYAVLLALILLSILATIGAVGAQTGGMWGNIETELRNVGFVAS